VVAGGQTVENGAAMITRSPRSTTRGLDCATVTAEAQAGGGGRLTGRRIVVVGGGQQSYGLDDAPIGNGRAIAIICAREGASVAVADIDQAAAEETVALARRESGEGGEVEAIAADASDEQGVVAMVEGTERLIGGLDGLVLNVGIAAGIGLQNTSAEDWDRVMAVNLRSHFLGLKHALPRMGPGGSAVLIGSVAGQRVMPLPAYSASKAALEALNRHAAIEGAPDVRVNLLVPGLIDTSLGRLATELYPQRAKVPIPLGRQGTAWEVANAALFLLSEEASYVTGASLVVDGGLMHTTRLG
jgi:NAD(P)-dependent dehydrogenase (short-subunit alcohol dehydrogenase family)